MYLTLRTFGAAALVRTMPHSTLRPQQRVPIRRARRRSRASSGAGRAGTLAVCFYNHAGFTIKYNKCTKS